jgi:WD40 repeat protein
LWHELARNGMKWQGLVMRGLAMHYPQLYIANFCCLIVLFWQNGIVRATDDVAVLLRVNDDVDRLPTAATARLGTSGWRKNNAIGTIRFTPSGNRIVSLSQEEAIVWSIKSGGKKTILRGQLGARPPYRALSSYTLTPDGTTLIAGIQGAHLLEGPKVENYILLQDIDTGKELRRFKKSPNIITGLAVSHRGDLLASCESKGKVRIWDIVTGEVRHTIDNTGRGSVHSINKGDQYTEPPRSIAFTKDDRFVAVVDEEGGQVHIIDVRLGVKRRSVSIGNPCSQPALSPDACFVAILQERSVRVWNLTTEKEQRLFDTESGYCRLAAGPDGKTLITVENHEGDLRFWDMTTGKELRHFKIPQFRASGCGALALSPNGKILASVEEWSCIHLWDATSGRPLRDSQAPILPAQAVAYSPDAKFLTSIVPWEGVYRWEISSARVLEKTRLPVNGSFSCLQISPSAKHGAFAEGKDVILWGLQTGANIRKLRQHAEQVTGVVFSPCGRRLASSSKDGSVCLWEVETGKLLRTLRPPKGAKSITWVAFGPDGRVVAGGERPLRLHLWNTDTGKHLTMIEADRGKWANERGSVLLDYTDWHCHFTPDGNTLITADSHKCLVWDLLRRAEVSPFPRTDAGHYGLPTVLSPDGRLLARFNGRPCTLWLWEVATGKPIYQFRDSAFSTAFSPDGRSIATACHDDGSILLWDLKKLFCSIQAATSSKASNPWLDLASPDAPLAYKVMGQLWTDEKAALALFTKHLEPTQAVDAMRVRSLLGDLDSAEFAIREKATKQLELLGESVRPFLEHTRASAVSLELRRRVEAILEKLPPISPEQLRQLRAVQVLEYMGTSAAQRQLQRLAEGDPEAGLTQAAKRALKRLETRSY